MTFVLIGLFLAAIGVIPLLAKGKGRAAFWQFVVTGFLEVCNNYGSTPAAIGPLLGPYGFLLLVNLGIAALIDNMEGSEYGENKLTWTVFPPILIILTMIVISFSSSEMLRWKEYSSLLTITESTDWTAGVQPKDPAHMLKSNEDNALSRMTTAVAGMGNTVGSQFSLDRDTVTKQIVNGAVWFVAPLDYNSYGAWRNTPGVPGYIMINGEDTNAQAIPVHLTGKEMKYTPGALFSYSLERHLRNNGYLTKGLTDYTFEIDENHNPWWVVSVYEPTIGWSGEQITGVLVVNPSTGEITPYSIGQIPDWIDRAVPKWILKQNLEWNGRYSNGYWNTWWFSAQVGITKPEDVNLVYGAGNQPLLVAGMTSHNDKDDSLTSIIYTNSRTGLTTKYVLKEGGATESAVLQASKSVVLPKALKTTKEDPSYKEVLANADKLLKSKIEGDITVYEYLPYCITQFGFVSGPAVNTLPIARDVVSRIKLMID